MCATRCLPGPASCIAKYPGRTRTVHFKPTVRQRDAGKRAILGRDSVDWRAVDAACASVGGTAWIVVDRETYSDGKPAIECTREWLAGLMRLLDQPHSQARPRV